MRPKRVNNDWNAKAKKKHYCTYLIALIAFKMRKIGGEKAKWKAQATERALQTQ